jgi:hypothetical protein
MNSAVWTYALSGAILLANAIIGLFFFRFWSKTADRLFLIFALAFWALVIERVLLLSIDPNHEFAPYVYTVRLCAFLLILAGIIDKNRK